MNDEEEDEAGDIPRFLFSPRGWIGRANYIRGGLYVLGLNVLVIICVSRFADAVPAADPYALAAILLTLPASLCITSKRLHALNLNGVIQAPVRVLTSAGIIMTGLVNQLHAGEAAKLAAAVVLVIGLVLDAGMYIWLLLSPERRQPSSAAAVFD